MNSHRFIAIGLLLAVGAINVKSRALGPAGNRELYEYACDVEGWGSIYFRSMNLYESFNFKVMMAIVSYDKSSTNPNESIRIRWRPPAFYENFDDDLNRGIDWPNHDVTNCINIKTKNEIPVSKVQDNENDKPHIDDALLPQ